MILKARDHGKLVWAFPDAGFAPARLSAFITIAAKKGFS
jgi:hypothetical protein